MNYWYERYDILVTPDQLWDFAWSAPMRDLAAKLDMSDVGLKKLLKTLGVVTPPQGHWNRVRAGRPVAGRPKLPPRQPGETGRIRLDRRFRDVLTETPPMSGDGPFVSKAVPEDLDELRAQEMKAIGRVGAPALSERYHPGLKSIVDQEGKRRAKLEASPSHWDGPHFDFPVARRQLRILNGVFLALAKRGHSGSAYDNNGELSATAVVGDTRVSLQVAIAGKVRTVLRHGYHRPDPALPASTPLLFKVEPQRDGSALEVLCDDKDGKLEAKIAAITASIIVAGEREFRLELRREIERKEQARLANEKARREKLAALNQQRIADLLKSGELLRQAEEIRALVLRVRAAAAVDAALLDQQTFDDWEAWARAEADKIDPVLSGQIHSHLRPPTLDCAELGRICLARFQTDRASQAAARGAAEPC